MSKTSGTAYSRVKVGNRGKEVSGKENSFQKRNASPKKQRGDGGWETSKEEEAGCLKEGRDSISRRGLSY